MNTGVSVVIPTIGRPALLRRALASALAQTLAPHEVIVIVDGPDPATEAMLATIADPRVQVLRNPAAQGPGPARNAAAARATGAWLAFLDDDDEWHPDKLARQLAGRHPADDIVLSCRCRVHTPGGTHVWPRRLPAPGEPLDDYLFARRSLLRGETYIATPSLVLPARLFARTRFGSTPQNEDTTLLLRATHEAGAQFVMLPDALVSVHAADLNQSFGSTYDWRQSLAWVQSMGPALSPRARSGFALVTLGSQAARQRDYGAIGVLLSDAWRHGAPTALQMALFAGFWAAPQGFRHRLRRWGGGARPAPC